jgi:hypothetical protein
MARYAIAPHATTKAKQVQRVPFHSSGTKRADKAFEIGIAWPVNESDRTHRISIGRAGVICKKEPRQPLSVRS